MTDYRKFCGNCNKWQQDTSMKGIGACSRDEMIRLHYDSACIYWHLDPHIEREGHINSLQIRAKDGIPEALYELGILYRTGKASDLGITQNRKQAEILIKEAANKGSIKACEYLNSQKQINKYGYVLFTIVSVLIAILCYFRPIFDLDEIFGNSNNGFVILLFTSIILGSVFGIFLAFRTRAGCFNTLAYSMVCAAAGIFMPLVIGLFCYYLWVSLSVSSIVISLVLYFKYKKKINKDILNSLTDHKKYFQ